MTTDTADIAAEQARIGGMAADAPLCVVYDADLFGYAGMLEIMSANTNGKIKLGTYSEKTKTVITPNEIIR